jgi:hypothetical protein
MKQVIFKVFSKQMEFEKSRSNRTLGSRGRGLIVIQCLTSGEGKKYHGGIIFFKFNVIDTYNKKICI